MGANNGPTFGRQVSIPEVILVLLLILMAASTLLGIYGPAGLRPMFLKVTMLSLVFLGISLIFIGIGNTLLAKMGFLNLFRHKGDSVIAVVGFMIGTSIVMSSLAIGDTMSSLVESLVYSRYHLADEVVYLRESSGNLTFFTGEQANNISEAVWSINDERDMIDGVSWEIEVSGSVIDTDTDLYEPIVDLWAFSEHTVDQFGGLYSGGSEVSYELLSDEVYITRDLADELDSEPGNILSISSGIKSANFTISAVLDQEGRAESFGGEHIYFSFQSLLSLINRSVDENGKFGKDGDWSGGHYNRLLISNKGGVIGGAEYGKDAVKRIDEKLEVFTIPPGSTNNPQVQEDKRSGVDRAMEGIDTFTKLFVTLGAFSIIAGITLIINIFIMLSEERSIEMGISRAIGMKRDQLRISYLFEGTFYSVISSGVGVIIGLAAGWLVIWIIENLIRTFDIADISILGHYSVVPSSVLLAFALGFTITLGTTLVITQRIARLNIVSAIRDTRPPKRLSMFQEKVLRSLRICPPEGYCESVGNPYYMVSFITSGKGIFGTLFALTGVVLILHAVNYRTLWSLLLGASLLTIGVSYLLRYFFGGRIVYTSASLLMLGIWIVPFPFLENYDSSIELFVMAGVFMVTSSVLLLVWNSDLILWSARKVLTAAGLSAAPINMAISYPLKKRFRTGVTIFMFALIIFTITGMSMFVNIFNINIEEIERTVGGGYDIIGISEVREIESLRTTVGQRWGTENLSKIDWERTTSLLLGYTKLNFSMSFGRYRDSLETPYLLCGLTDTFKRSTTYGFQDVDWSILRERGVAGKSDEDVWNALSDPELVIVDGFFGNNEWGPPGLGMKAGSVITLVKENGTQVRKTVLAITDQFAISAVFMNQETAESEFNITQRSLHMISLAKGASSRDVSSGLERNLLDYGLFTIVIRDVVMEILEIQNAFFDLFNAYMSLGLVIGLVGLGTLTLRSVYERRHEIGMMRAIGFKRRAVVGTFLGESSFVAVSGLFVGITMGIVLGWKLWEDQVSDSLPLFGVPWSRLLIIFSIALFFSLLSSLPPSFTASRVSPAEALRYE